MNKFVLALCVLSSLSSFAAERNFCLEKAAENSNLESREYRRLKSEGDFYYSQVSTSQIKCKYGSGPAHRACADLQTALVSLESITPDIQRARARMDLASAFYTAIESLEYTGLEFGTTFVEYLKKSGDSRTKVLESSSSEKQRVLTLAKQLSMGGQLCVGLDTPTPSASAALVFGRAGISK